MRRRDGPRRLARAASSAAIGTSAGAPAASPSTPDGARSRRTVMAATMTWATPEREDVIVESSPAETTPAPLGAAELDAIDAWWRAANYLAVGQIYLLANPLLREPLRPEHVKPRLLGHWGTTPGLNLLYAHVNRLIRAHDIDALFIAGPGHGGPAMCASTWLEGRTASTGRPSRRTSTACRSSSASSRSPAACRATSHRRRRARSTRAASSATRSATPTAPRSTTPICWWRA